MFIISMQLDSPELSMGIYKISDINKIPLPMNLPAPGEHGHRVSYALNLELMKSITSYSPEL